MATRYILGIVLAFSCFGSLDISASTLSAANTPSRHVYGKEPIDAAEKYQIEWEVDMTTNVITFSLEVETKGFVGFGLISSQVTNDIALVY
jgi:hypothetical protein